MSKTTKFYNVGTLSPLRDKFIDLSKWPSVGLISNGSHAPNDALWSLEDMAKPFNSLYGDYSNQMSQWYKIIPWNWRVSAMAVASHWEKIPWAGWTRAASEWKSKASAQGESPVVTLLCALIASLTFPSSLPLLSLHWDQQTWHYSHGYQILVGKRTLNRERWLKLPRPNQRDSDFRVFGWDPRICTLSRHPRWLWDRR